MWCEIRCRLRWFPLWRTQESSPTDMHISCNHLFAIRIFSTFTRTLSIDVLEVHQKWVLCSNSRHHVILSESACGECLWLQFIYQIQWRRELCSGPIWPSGMMCTPICSSYIVCLTHHAAFTIKYLWQHRFVVDLKCRNVRMTLELLGKSNKCAWWWTHVQPSILECFQLRLLYSKYTSLSQSSTHLIIKILKMPCDEKESHLLGRDVA